MIIKLHRPVTFKLLLGGGGALLLLFACGGKDPNAIQVAHLVVEKNNKTKTYRFDIPNAYIKGRYGPDWFNLISAYPEGRTREDIHRLKNVGGPRHDDVVRIFISAIGKNKEKTINELGREGMKKLLLSSPYFEYSLVPVSEDIDESNRVDKFMTPRDESFQGVFIIAQKNQRIAKIKCTFETTCSGYTIWNSDISIRYDFSRKNFNKMVELDRSVVSLIDSFKPRLIGKE